MDPRYVEARELNGEIYLLEYLDGEFHQAALWNGLNLADDMWGVYYHGFDDHDRTTGLFEIDFQDSTLLGSLIERECEIHTSRMSPETLARCGGEFGILSAIA